MWSPLTAPVAHLVRVAAIFGFRDNAVRVALSRLDARGRVSRGDAGGRPGYALSSSSAALADLVRLATEERPEHEWDRRWLQIVVSVPERQKSDRLLVQKLLSGLGFASPYRGVWMRPTSGAIQWQELGRRLANAAPSASYDTFLCELPERSRELAFTRDLYQLAERSGRLTELCASAESLLARHRELPLDRALQDSFLLASELAREIVYDPRLPAELLPEEWPGAKLRELYRRIRSECAYHWVEFALRSEDRAGLDNDELVERFSSVVAEMSHADPTTAALLEELRG